MPRNFKLALCASLLLGLYSSFSTAAMAMTVLVTGANRGIGLELVKQLEGRGMNVIGTARKPAEAEALRATGARVEQLDVADSASLAALAKSLDGVPIDMLINNAGIMGHTAESFQQTDFAAIETTFVVNSLGPMRVTQALLDNLQAGRHKTVIQISSVLGSIEQNQGGYYGYRASKAALNMMNKSLALELAGDGFTCVVMHPGWVKTRLGGKGAQITTVESVSGMLEVIAELDAEDNGGFFDYQGNEIPW
jgi:NAD(P)-dependent dehydrogenase (short-subunit alcohol dehydrogenase family)